ncbi:hypothetical protein [Schaalia vaccimaxillae]|uniref:hypothetical protein n=1 Tax=Schaalia vaccimaxillae TaxID=183916 RepID=UPI0003B64403|nr:hypothetical protein [Schaalia vaccimaxillae]
MKKQMIDYELADGTTGTVRILAVDKIAFEHHCRAHGKPLEDGPSAIACMLHSALKRAELIETDFDTFVTDELIDYAAEQVEADAENPTR